MAFQHLKTSRAVAVALLASSSPIIIETAEGITPQEVAAASVEPVAEGLGDLTFAGSGQVRDTNNSCLFDRLPRRSGRDLGVKRFSAFLFDSEQRKCAGGQARRGNEGRNSGNPARVAVDVE